MGLSSDRNFWKHINKENIASCLYKKKPLMFNNYRVRIGIDDSYLGVIYCRMSFILFTFSQPSFKTRESRGKGSESGVGSPVGHQ